MPQKIDPDVLSTLKDSFDIMDAACDSLAQGIRKAIDNINELIHDSHDEESPEDREAKIVRSHEMILEAHVFNPMLVSKGAPVIHYKGHEANVKGCGILESTLEPVVIYQESRVIKLPNGDEIQPTWIRPLEDFVSDVKLPDGRIVSRFIPNSVRQTEDEIATQYPGNIAPVESVRDFAIQEPPPGHNVDASVIAEDRDQEADSESLSEPERVMAIPSGRITWEGLKCDFAMDWLKKNVYPNETTQFPLKDDAEKDLSIKQIIPYIVIRCGSRFAVFQRNKMAGENRLKGKITIGVGGHVNINDGKISEVSSDGYTVRFSNESAIQSAIIREINEEVPELNASDFRSMFTGLMNWSGDEDNGVGKYHLGIVYQITVNTPIEFKEKDQGLSFLGWWTGAELHRCVATGKTPTPQEKGEFAEMEMWTQVLVDSGIVPNSYS